jgi:aminoglycoside 2'-N-acetyltransferase I
MFTAWDDPAAADGVLHDALRGPASTAARALGATDRAAHFYAARGWELWQGPTSALTPTGILRTE